MRKILFYIPLEKLGLTSIPVFSYGFMMMVAFIAAIMLAKWRAKKEGIKEDYIYDISLAAIISGVIGSRLMWLFLFSPEGTWKSFTEIIAVWNGGLVYYGGLLLSLLICGIYIKRKKLALGLTVDCFAPGMALGIFFGRIGCFLNGCCYGAVCGAEKWYAVKFPPGSPASFEHFGFDVFNETSSLAVYPTQLFSSAGGLICFLIILLLFKFRKFPGQVTLHFLQVYALMRFMVEFLRDDTPPYFAYGWFPGLKAGQIIALLTFIIASAAIGYFLKRGGMIPHTKNAA